MAILESGAQGFQEFYWQGNYQHKVLNPWPIHHKAIHCRIRLELMGESMFGNMTIRTRLMMSFGAILVLLIAAAGAGRWGMYSLHQDVTKTINSDVALAQIASDLNADVLMLRRFEKDSFININAAESVASYFKKWQDALNVLRDDLKRATDVANDETKSTLNDFSGAVSAYETGFLQVHSLITASQVTTTQQANAEMGKFKETIHRTEDLAKEIKTSSGKRAGEIHEHLQSKRNSLDITLLILAVAALVVSGALALYITRYITSSIDNAVAMATQVAEGRLGQEVKQTSSDELGDLTRALQNMDGQLCEVISSVRVAASTVSNAAREISQGNDHLSERTQEQASALEQTAASVEEITASVKQNADNTANATQLAHRARNIAETGGTVVQEAIVAMGEINRSSKRIADIIGVIDEIAFQTNLLALNAAVEAARAGEQGRGFAVVAAEVRNLAQRSAEAAKEIKTLILDSTHKVEIGAKLVEQSGTTLSEIVTSTKQVSSVVDEIAAANKEHSSGIMQINHAVTQLDTMTQQNAAAVEEMAATSKALESQAQALKQQVEHFQILNGSHAASATRHEQAYAPAQLMTHQSPPRAKAA